MERTYGVELEIHHRNVPRSAIVSALTRAGLTAYVGNRGGIPHGWKVTTDGSLGSYNESSEIVSPILRGDTGFEQIAKVCNAVRAAGATVDAKCGLHVHVDVVRPRPLNVAALKRLIKLYADNENTINTVLETNRRASHWCKSLVKIIRKSEFHAADSIAELQRVIDDKYLRIRLTIFKDGTVEFRQYQGTLDHNEIQRWVTFCLKMVDAAEAGTEIIKYGNGKVHRSDRGKNLILYQLLTRPEGVTTPEACVATGWQQISVAGRAHLMGLDLRIKKEWGGKKKISRYFGHVAADVPGQVRVRRPRSLEEFAQVLKLSPTEIVFWTKRANELAGNQIALPAAAVAAQAQSRVDANTRFFYAAPNRTRIS